MTEGTELFEPPDKGLPETREWYSEFILSHYAKSWTKMLHETTARPQRVPERILLTWLGAWPLARFGDYELRALAIHASEDAWIELREGWPHVWAGDADRQPPHIADADLSLKALPPSDASDGELYAFAATTDGYRRMGEFHRFARLANGVLDAWRRTGDLPITDVAHIRCCLFFESRRAHFGFESPETIPLMRALVDRLREVLTESEASRAR